MSDMEELLNNTADEVFIERLMLNVDVERLDGTILENVAMIRKEKIADGEDIESVYEHEYVAENGDEEVYLGDDKGNNIIIKERAI